MKVVAFNGSPRSGGNTEHLIEKVFSRLRTHDIDCERVDIADNPLRGCTACYGCVRNQTRCVLKDDLNHWFEKARQADGILLGSPTYFADVSTEMKALIDRSGMVGRANNHLYKRKIGASVVAVRRAGGIHAFDSMNHFFLISQMIIVGSSYWNIGIGREKGEVAGDQEGMETMRQLGENMAWLLKKIKA